MFKNSRIRYRMWALIFSLTFFVFTYFVKIHYNYYETFFQNPSLNASIVWPFGVLKLTGTSGIIGYSVVFIFYVCFIVVVSTKKNNPRNIAIMLGLMAVHSLYLLLLRMHYINMDNSIYSFEIYSIKDSLWKLASCLTLAVLFFLKNKKKLKKESTIQIIIIGMIVITLFLDGIGIGPFYATMTCFDVSALLRYLSLLFCLSMTDKAQNACEHGLF